MRDCLIFLIDESAGMLTPVARPANSGLELTPVTRKSKLESVATVVNSLLARLKHRSNLDIGLVGYCAQQDGTDLIGSRWPEELSNEPIVSAGELTENEISIEKRIRRTPQADGSVAEQEMDFPIWFVPNPGEEPGRAAAALSHCRALLSDWCQDQAEAAGRAVVIHITGSPLGGSEVAAEAKSLYDLEVGDSTPSVLHIHLASHDAVPALVLPANRALIPSGSARDLFDIAQEIPESVAAVFRDAGLSVGDRPRGAIYNARMVDMRRLCDAALKLLDTQESIPEGGGNEGKPAAYQDLETKPSPVPVASAKATHTGAELHQDDAPAPSNLADIAGAAVEELANSASITAETPCLLVFVIDRSDADPEAAQPGNGCEKLCDTVASTIGWLEQVGAGAVDVSIVTYANDAQGTVVVSNELPGGKTSVRNTDFGAVALRAEEYVEERSDGVGGLIQIPRKRIHLIDPEPGYPAPMTPAIQNALELVRGWCSEHPESRFPSTIIHLAHGENDVSDLQSASALTSPHEPVVLYHYLLTEPVTTTVTLPDHNSLVPESMQGYWECSSALLLSDHISEFKTQVRPHCRGFVINGDLNDLLLPAKWKIDEGQ